MSNRRVPADFDNASDETQGEGGRQGEATGLDPADADADADAAKKTMMISCLAGHTHLEASH